MRLGGVSRDPRGIELGFTPKVAVSPVASGTPVFADGETIDAQKGSDTVDDEHSPVHIDDKGESKVYPDVQKLQPGGNDWEAEDG